MECRLRVDRSTPAPRKENASRRFAFPRGPRAAWPRARRSGPAGRRQQSNAAKIVGNGVFVSRSLISQAPLRYLLGSVELGFVGGGTKRMMHPSNRKRLKRHYLDRIAPILAGTAEPNWKKFDRCLAATASARRPRLSLSYVRVAAPALGLPVAADYPRRAPRRRRGSSEERPRDERARRRSRTRTCRRRRARTSSTTQTRRPSASTGC